MKMSDIIADFIGEMLSEGGGVAEVQRKSLADRFSCVPSQINYVIETRFTPEHGYLVESRLTRALVSAELLTQREGQLLLSACSDGALAEVEKSDRDRLRAAIFRCAVMGVATI